MKQEKIILGLILFGLSCYSCKKDTPTDCIHCGFNTVSEKVTDYYPLTIGSYWIYHHYEIDTNNVEKFIKEDSVYIFKDSMINEKLYYEKKSKYSGSHRLFIRDSSDYIVHDDGHILFSNTNFVDTLMIYAIPEYSTTYYKMAHKDSIISVPAGIYKTYDVEKTTFFVSKYRWSNPRFAHKFYAKGIGLVKEREYYDSSPNYIESRLIRYHIN